jgi:hypothetical protein
MYLKKQENSLSVFGFFRESCLVLLLVKWEKDLDASSIGWDETMCSEQTMSS